MCGYPKITSDKEWTFKTGKCQLTVETIKVSGTGDGTRLQWMGTELDYGLIIADNE